MVRQVGARQMARAIEHYSLGAILAVVFRVRPTGRRPGLVAFKGEKAENAFFTLWTGHIEKNSVSCVGK